jgi:hypothetical protein
MRCEELEKLRANVRQLQAKAKDSHRKSAAARQGDRRDDPRHVHGSTVEVLKRRIARASAAIEEHVVNHGCHDPE